MTENPLADAIAKMLDVGHPPVFKIVVSMLCPSGQMYVLNPEGWHGLDLALEAKHPGLKIIVVPTAKAAEMIREAAEALDLELVDDGD